MKARLIRHRLIHRDSSGVEKVDQPGELNRAVRPLEAMRRGQDDTRADQRAAAIAVIGEGDLDDGPPNPIVLEHAVAAGDGEGRVA